MTRVEVEVGRSGGATGGAEVSGLSGKKRTEISRFLGGRGNETALGLALNQSQSFIASKKERLVLPNRTTQGAAILVADEFWSIRGKEVARIKIPVAHVLPRGAMKAVAARFRDQVHCCTGSNSKRRVVSIILDL